MSIDFTRAHARWTMLCGYVLFFARGLFDFDAVPYYRDHLVTNVPLREYLRERAASGELAQWYPFEALGVPVIGQIALGTFHPITWATLWLPTPHAEKWVLLIAYAFALAGAYRAARAFGASRLASVGGAFAYSFGGYALGLSSITAYVLGVGAMPWVLWSARRLSLTDGRRHLATLALSAALVFLGGDAPGYLACGAVCAACWALQPSAKSAALFFGAGALSASLVAIELLPALGVTADSVRAVGQAPPSLLFTWALHPWRLAEFVMGGFVPDEVRAEVVSQFLGGGSTFFITTVFIGVMSLACIGAALASTARRTSAVFFGVFVVSILVALGGRFPLLPVLGKLIPLFTRFRYPERYLFVAFTSLIVLVPLGIDALKTQTPRRAFVGTAMALTVGALALTLLGPAAIFWSGTQTHPEAGTVEAVGRAWLLSGLFAATFAAIASLTLWWRPAQAPFVIPALIFFELWRVNAGHLPWVSAQEFNQAHPFSAALQASAPPNGPPARVMPLAPWRWPSGVSLAGKETWVKGTRAILRASTSGYFGLSSLSSNLGAQFRRHALVFGVRDEFMERFGPTFNGCFATLDARGASDAAAPFVAVAPEVDVGLQPRPCWPRAFLAETRQVANENEARSVMNAASLDARVVPWEGGPTVALASGSVAWANHSPEHLALDVTADGPAALVVTDAFAPGWTATVDGQPQPIHPTLIAARGVEVPAGTHRVEFQYRTPNMAGGVAVSLSGLLVAFGLAFWRPRRR